MRIEEIREISDQKKKNAQRELRGSSLAIAGAQLELLRVAMDLEDDRSKCLLMAGIYNVSEEEADWLERREYGDYPARPPGYWVWANLRGTVLERLGRFGVVPADVIDGLWIDHINHEDVGMAAMGLASLLDGFLEHLIEEGIDDRRRDS